MTPTQQHHTLKTAIRYGGNFIRTLAAAGLLADQNNLDRIFASFPELITTYGPASPFYSELGDGH